jgi:hypothetical protein
MNSAAITTSTEAAAVPQWRERAARFIRIHWRPLTLLTLSAALAALYIIGRPYILYNDGDPLTYFRKAWWYTGH